MNNLIFEKESYAIRGGCFEVYKQFRNRHKEKVYRRALVIFLKSRGLEIEEEKQIPIYFMGEKVGLYIPDIVVNKSIFLELKCKPFVSKDDINQFWYYLKVTDFILGFLINFGSSSGVEIFRRVHSK